MKFLKISVMKSIMNISGGRNNNYLTAAAFWPQMNNAKANPVRAQEGTEAAVKKLVIMELVWMCHMSPSWRCRFWGREKKKSRCRQDFLRHDAAISILQTWVTSSFKT